MINIITEKYQTKAFKKYFAFFAFNKKQFEKNVNNNFQYADLGGGLYAPVDFAIKLIQTLSTITDKAIAQVQATHTNKEIIWYELGNHECQITGSIDDALEALSLYKDITKQDILDEYIPYLDHCVENNYF